MIYLLFFNLLNYQLAICSSLYVGAASCESCHPQQYLSWQKTAHAKAFDSLIGAQKKNPLCLNCHSLSDENSDFRFQGVQCESCHGGGKYYMASYVMRDKELARVLGLVDVTEKTCLRCHDNQAPHIQPFQFQQAWQKIIHSPKQ